MKKLGEGGCGAVYKVQDIKNAGFQAALKAESNFVAGGTVLKLEVQVLRRLTGLLHVPQLLHAGKKEQYCYMVMTLLGKKHPAFLPIFLGGHDLHGFNLLNFTRRKTNKIPRAIQVGFVHRDLKPANVAVGQANTPAYRFLHILDFGLSREYIVMDENKKLQMRRPRPRTLFRGTTRYCSINTHNKGEQGRVDDLWSVLTLNYYSHPDYAELHRYLMEVMKIGNFKLVTFWPGSMLILETMN
ncbi:unnamed protein product [Angiostrongylus costaricensis]|uniref:Protein kinase domain-containing protein n=1 Tax=Angiostrongylus costaricensis TaxID=334426 RepID=A0A158PEA1_ANGCS|nr:unnamed protein product [Angiostrongylus costaricensis]